MGIAKPVSSLKYHGHHVHRMLCMSSLQDETGLIPTLWKEKSLQINILYTHRRCEYLVFSLRSVWIEVQRPEDDSIPEQMLMVLSWYLGDICDRGKREEVIYDESWVVTLSVDEYILIRSCGLKRK